MPGQSIGELVFDPTDPTYQTIVAGIGTYSSYYREGSQRAGLLRTTDGGQSWQHLGTQDIYNPTGLIGLNINGIAARGRFMVLTAGSAEATGGVFVGSITSTIQTFNRWDGTYGLPFGAGFDLAEDPSEPQRFFVATTAGIFRCDDVLFTPNFVNVTPKDLLNPFTTFINSSTTNVELSFQTYGGTSALYAAIINTGRLEYLFRSSNLGANWVPMDVPAVVEAAQIPITDASFTNPIVITSAKAHGLSNGHTVDVTGVTGNFAANGQWTVNVTGSNQFELNGTFASGGYTGGGTWLRRNYISDATTPTQSASFVQSRPSRQ